jgi:hypothetical protein
MLLPSAASAACTGVWDLSGRWILSQTNMADGDVVVVDFLPGFGDVLRGSAAFRIAGSNRVDGRITGNSFSFTVPWARINSVGVYTGVIDAQGRIGGTTFDRNHPKNTAGWRGNRAAKCIVAASEPPPVVASPPVKAIGRVKLPAGTPKNASLSICDAARAARARDSPAAPGLEAQCLAAGSQSTDLTVVSLKGPGSLQAGLSGTYTVTVRNGGSVTAPVELHIVFAKALDQTGQIVAGGGLDCTVGHDAGINAGLTCTGGQLAGGESTTVIVQGRGQNPGVGVLLATINNNVKQINVTIN